MIFTHTGGAGDVVGETLGYIYRSKCVVVVQRVKKESEKFGVNERIKACKLCVCSDNKYDTTMLKYI